MKKVLSVVLAVMMLFSVMAVNTSAVNDDYADIRGEGDFVVVLYLDNCTMDAGRLTGRYRVYDEARNLITGTQSVTGTILVASDEFRCGEGWYLPDFKSPDPELYIPAGWRDTATRERFVSGDGGTFKFPTDNTRGTVVSLEACIQNVDAGSDTMATVMNVLVKVFGAIIGILLYAGDTDAGVAMMNKILGGLEL